MQYLSLSPEQQTLLPSEQDLAFYEANGYYISQPGVIPDDLIEQAIYGSTRFYQGKRDAELPVNTGYSNSITIDDITPRNHEFVSLQIKQFKDLATYPLIGAIAARLTRSKAIRLLDDQLIWKPADPERPANSITGWHTDQAYWATCSSEKLTTAWIPLHDVERSRSPLVVIARSHLWPGTQDLRHFNVRNLDELVETFRGEGKDIDIVPLTLRKGQLSFHHARTVHASLPNTSTQPRLSFAVHLQDGDNHYRPFTNAQGREIHIFDEQLCRKLPNGDPDFSDPTIFPVLWQEAP